MRVYLDNCRFTRPFDNQSSIRVKLETDAQLFVRLKIKEGKINGAINKLIAAESSKK
jgi:hypothetical protein